MADAEEKILIIRNDISISHSTRKITRIISNVHTGADHSVFYVPTEKGILQGSWISKGRKTQDALAPEKYHWKEMETPTFLKRIEQGVNFDDLVKNQKSFALGRLTSFRRRPE
jgi:hypothetical protein